MEKYFGLVFILILFLAKGIFQPAVFLGDATPSRTEVLPVNQSVVTKSSFTEKLHEETAVLTKKIIYKDDPETEAGEERVLEEGTDGKKTKIIRITLNKDGSEYERKTVSVDIVEPKDKIILKGTKIVWKTLDTPGGQITYWKKLRVYATHYDSHCPGCNEWTAIGMRAGKGVIAVDPSTIPLRTKVYIPEYGQAVAGDTGGVIKGKIIDLGFDDAKTAGWKAHFIDIYLLN